LILLLLTAGTEAAKEPGAEICSAFFNHQRDQKMRKKLLAAVAIAGALAAPAFSWAEDQPAAPAAPAAAAAEPQSPHTLTANVGVFSQYIFRGLTQTNQEPAVQGGFDYSYAFSGAPVTFYVGTWGSNISWLRENASVATAFGTFGTGTYSGGGSLELDLYGGLRGNFGKTDFTWDVGYLYYWYPGTLTPTIPPNFNISADTSELYAALGWKWFTVKYSYSLGKTFGVDDAQGTYYLDFSASYPIGDTGVTAGAHYGIQKYTGNDRRNVGLASNDELFSYDDWRISLAYDLGKASKVLSGAEIGAMYTDVSGASPCGYGQASVFPISFAGPLAAPCFGAYPRNIATSQFTAWFKKTF
jgi:uncharacterized protein (TIGR02001 family)